MFVIDDSTPPSKLYPHGMGRGLDLRDRPNRDGYGYGDAADPFNSDLLIPEHEWQGRIEEKEEQKSNVSNLLKSNGIKPKNQKQVPYCWIFCVTRAVEIRRFQTGAPFVSLSPASAGAQIKNFQEVGGWPKEGIEFVAEHGLVPSSLWDDTAIDRNLLTPEAKAEALKYRATEWMELKPRNKAQLVSCLLRNIPVAVGLNHWGHAVVCVDAVWLNGQVAVRFENSWDYSWGDEGYGVLAESKMLPDDAVACRVVMGA